MILNCPGESNVITWVLKSEELFLVVVRERDVLNESRSERCYVTGFKDGEEGLKQNQEMWAASRS